MCADEVEFVFAKEVNPEQMDVLYLGVGGVLQPSVEMYRCTHGRDPFEDGHRRYEYAPLLAEMLKGWPELRIVLTSTRPWKHGLDPVLAELGPELATRVIGFTFDDLTTRARFGERFPRPLSEMDYWRLGKAQVVEKHVHWLRPARWLVVDDDGYGWSDQELTCNVVVTPALEGLASEGARDKLHGLLVHHLGPPYPPQFGDSDEDGRSERGHRRSARLFDPAQAQRFTLAAAAHRFGHVEPRPTVLLLGLERTLFTFVDGGLRVRPHAFSFLHSCDDLFERLVVMPDDIDQFHRVADELSKRGAVPSWFPHLDCLAWNGCVKDLERIGAATFAEAIAVDANREFIVPGQEERWLSVTLFDGSPQDDELLHLCERLSRH